MKVLVIAQEGQIRDALEKQLTLRDRAYQCVGPAWFGVGAKKAVVAGAGVKLPKGVSVVFNALSLELFEQTPDQGLLAPLVQLAQACHRRGVPLILLSSSMVYGEVDGVHRESEPPVPGNAAGELLLRMEQAVTEQCEQSIVLRTGPLFSSMGDNLLTNLLRNFENGQALQLSNAGDSCPLHTSDLARVVSAIIDQLSCGAEVWGTYHYCSADYVSSYQFAEAVLAVVSQYEKGANQTLKLQPVEAADTRWSRPLLNCEKILNTFGVKQLPWRAFIAPTVKKYFHPEQVLDEPMLMQSIKTVQKENFDG